MNLPARSKVNLSSLCTQGVVRVRKRVTLMVVAVSAIFGICYITVSVEYVLIYLTSHSSGRVQNAITNTMVLFNSAFNPFLYALMNKQFRDKMKQMTCHISRAHPTHDLRSPGLAYVFPVPRAGQCSRKCSNTKLP